MWKRLYVIGNGFDLHHGLKTAYSDFAAYLKKSDVPLYSTLESYINFPKSDKDLWGRFEENLANLQVDEIISDHSDSLPDYASDDFREGDRYIFPDTMEELYKSLTSGLIETFSQFIRNLHYPASANERKVQLDPSAAVFLNFNYTDTLERMYYIDRKQILYIHNATHSQSDGIILGHGTDPKKFETEFPSVPDGLSEEETERWYEQNASYDYSYNEGKEIIMRYFKTNYKPTADIIKRNRSFFSHL